MTQAAVLAPPFPAGFRHFVDRRARSWPRFAIDFIEKDRGCFGALVPRGANIVLKKLHALPQSSDLFPETPNLYLQRQDLFPDLCLQRQDDRAKIRALRLGNFPREGFGRWCSPE
mmetsp:Transcript_60073/g.137285  ORF Transcript_60073/g.137285 Transcript_60073/m.137285 type:complete len:115 (+) Transcript_60073:248-592(+)